MDPNTAFRNWLDSLANGDDEGLFEATDSLVGWLVTGGFSPGWTPCQRSAFVAYARTLGSKLQVRDDGSVR